jgi:DnaJ-class molecular chaperone
MMGRQDLELGQCPECFGTGRDGKNRKRACPHCDGTGTAWYCENCGGRYGVECVDEVMDQSHCAKEKKA